MATLRLLGGPAEECPGVVISGDPEVDLWREERRLRRAAQAAHQVWLTDPVRPGAKREFGLALWRWAEFVGREEARVYALSLLD